MFYFGSANIEALFYFAKPLLIKTHLFSYRLIFSVFQQKNTYESLVSQGLQLIKERNGYIVKKWYNCV